MAKVLLETVRVGSAHREAFPARERSQPKITAGAEAGPEVQRALRDSHSLPGMFLGVSSVCPSWLGITGRRRPGAPGREPAPLVLGICRGGTVPAVPARGRQRATHIPEMGTGMPRQCWDGHGQRAAHSSSARVCSEQAPRDASARQTPLTPQTYPKEQLAFPGNVGTVRLQRGSDSNSQCRPPGAPAQPQIVPAPQTPSFQTGDIISSVKSKESSLTEMKP